MGLFSRKNREDEDPFALQDAIDVAKRQAREFSDAKYFHQTKEQPHRELTKEEKKAPRSGPSCDSASTPKRRYW